MLISKIFHSNPFPFFVKIFHARIFIHALNNYSLSIYSETNMGSTKSCQFNFLQVGCLRCQHPISYHSTHHHDSNNQDVKYLIANFRVPYFRVHPIIPHIAGNCKHFFKSFFIVPSRLEQYVCFGIVL